MKIAINGRTGRMGKLIANCLLEWNHTAEICTLTDQPDVIVDFSRPLATISLLPFVVEHRIPLVIGTTGFSGAQQVQITKAAEKTPIVQSANMSMGANIFFKAVEKLSGHLVSQGVQFDVGITEIHHHEKQDQPSGTALWLGQAVESSAYGGEVQYASLRLGDIAGEHEVIFALPGEQLTVKHHADTRINFALGALKAVEWLLGQRAPGLYDMQQVLGLHLV